jgi:predicted neuraminidase
MTPEPLVATPLIVLAFALVPAALASAQPAAVVSSEFVYASAPYPECHASTIVEAAPGTLVAAWFGGTRERAPDVSIYVARKEGGRWSEPVMVADGVQQDGTRQPTWNPVLFQPRAGGPLFLFYKVGPSPREWWGMVTTSTDAGRTWGPPSRLPDGILGPIKNKPVVLADGAWLAPSSTEAQGDRWMVHFERSADAGRTWEKIGPVDASRTRLDAIQPSVLFHRDGALQALCRTRQGVVAQTWSRDGGRTWSPLAATELPNPNSGTDAITLADGRQLIVYNHSAHRPESPASGDRWPLDVAVSTDGLTWSRVLTLEREPLPSGYAYPAVIQASDGLVHVTYTWDRKRIKHVVIDPRRL